jgi:hypothetical protein
MNHTHQTTLKSIFIYEFFGAALFAYGVFLYKGDAFMSAANLLAAMILTYKHTGAHVSKPNIFRGQLFHNNESLFQQ